MKDGINQSRNTKNIVLLGLVSMFVDMSTEMVYPIIPLFLVSLGTAPYFIGIIEGVAESIAAFLKTFAGYISDRYNSRKALAIFGYSTSAIYKIGLLLSTTWVGVLLSRVIDRTGKGLRTVPRDSLIAESGGKNMGGSFGLHKMFDMLGAGVGVLLAYIILNFEYQYKSVILISVIPSIIGVAILLFVKETHGKKATATERIPVKNLKLDAKLKLYLVFVFVFSIGNLSKVFLLLKAQNFGFDSKNILLLYFLFNMTASLGSIPFGKVSDKFSRIVLIIPSYLLYALICFGFAFTVYKYSFIALFFLYGIFTAMISGSERALLVETSPKAFKGTVLGIYGTIQGLGILLSSAIAGVIWNALGTQAPFIIGGTLSVISAIGILLLRMGKKPNQSQDVGV